MTENRLKKGGACDAGAPYCFIVTYYRSSINSPTLLAKGGGEVWIDESANTGQIEDIEISRTVNNVDCEGIFTVRDDFLYFIISLLLFF